MVKLYRLGAIALLSLTTLYADDLGVVDIFSKSTQESTSASIDFLSQSEQKMNQLIIQQSSPGVYNPIKEGLQGDKILLDVNGIRMTNALFRSGPNQYFSWIPRSFVSRIEEDAPSRLMLNNSMGGEINQVLGVDASHVGFNYSTYNRGFESTASYKDDASSAGVLWLETGNFHDTHGEVPHSDYNQKAFFAQSDVLEGHEMTFLLSQSNDIPRTDHYAKEDPYDYELQRYILLSDAIDFSTFGQLKLSFQNFEEEIQERQGEVSTNNAIYGAIYSYNVSDNLAISLSDYFEDVSYNQSDFYYNTLNLQGAYEVSTNTLNLLMAYTFSYANVSGDISNHFLNHSGLIRVSKNSWYLSAVQGHRFPSIVNLAKSIITEKGIDLPNSDLKPETSTTFALGYNDDTFFFKAYYRLLDNLISRKLLPEPVGGVEAYQTINDKSGEMYGVIAGSNYDYKALKTSLYLEYSYGKTESDYISKITPFHASLMMQYHNVYAQHLYGMKSDTMSVGDQHDIRIIGHNSGYNITNLGYRYQQKHHELKVTLNNLFNKEGRVYASSVDWPKRSVSFGYKYYF
ncbi:MAG: hypothetical protein U9N52_13045 [Campylobacterota bacterium]|nr:hypothetical protein [Campylobacterota bacterium]